MGPGLPGKQALWVYKSYCKDFLFSVALPSEQDSLARTNRCSVEGGTPSAPLVTLIHPSSHSSLGHFFCQVALWWKSSSSFEVSHVSLPAPSEITVPPLAVTDSRLGPVGLILLPGQAYMAWLP